MGNRVWNFSAGPSALPLPVLEKAQSELLSLPGAGASVMEISHRSKPFDDVICEAKENIRALYKLPDNYKILFIQGGASLQFSMIPLNFMKGTGKGADYIQTGTWGTKAIKEAKREGDVNVLFNSKEQNFNCVPANSDLSPNNDAAYLHFTSNETIQGVQFKEEPATGAPLICDASSDFLSRPLDVNKYAYIYAGAQKNAGPAGVVIGIMREDMLERIPQEGHSLLDYRTYVDKDSMYNTPPCFAIYIVSLVSRWLKDDIGGLEKIEEINNRKAGMLYDTIDNSDGFYKGHAEKNCRSPMNVPWTMGTEELEKKFLAESAEHGLATLKGHRSVGGLRASIYNAMPTEGVKALCDFMNDFQKKNG